MDKNFISKYHKAQALASAAKKRLEKYKGIVEHVGETPDEQLKEKIMAMVTECDARQIVDWYESRLNEWIASQPVTARKALTYHIIDGMPLNKACSKADPGNVNFTRELVSRLIKELPEKQ